MVEGLESNKSALSTLLKRVAFPKLTHYNETFDVVAKHEPNNIAYTPDTIGLHVDLPYYEYGPGVSAD